MQTDPLPVGKMARINDPGSPMHGLTGFVAGHCVAQRNQGSMVHLTLLDLGHYGSLEASRKDFERPCTISLLPVADEWLELVAL